jgi:cobalt-zinc-cadmium efflux system membrane fusion protein
MSVSADRRSPLHAALGAVPTLLVLAAAGTLGWWGHHHEWKLPKFSELSGQVKEPDDWCGEHNVPRSKCVECDPTLMPHAEHFGWCEHHGIPECVLCHPELAQSVTPPVVTPADRERAMNALTFAERTSNTAACEKHHRRIQYATAKDADKAGVKTELVWTASVAECVAAPGELGYDQSKIAHLSSRSPGSVWKVFKHLGQEVKAGEVLALVDAAEVGKAKAELLLAVASLRAKEQTVIAASGGVVAPAKLKEAEAAVVEAEIRVTAGCQWLTNLGLRVDEADVKAIAVEQLRSKLHLLGLPPEVAKGIDPKAAPTTLLPLVAPIDGRVMSREMVAGEVVDTARILFEVVDTRAVWLTLDVKGEDAARVKVGQPVRFRPDGGKVELSGTLSWRSSQADPKTRTVKVRADLPDPHQTLVANTFGTGKVILREEAKAIVVPNEAVQWDGCCHVVFVRDRDYLKSEFKVFHVRKVRVGVRGEKTTEVIAGVLPGELVVTKGSGLMLNELLRGELGEGCACCHPK